MGNEFSMYFIKFLCDDMPQPTDNFAGAIILLFLIFLCLLFVKYNKKTKFNLKPVLFSIPLVSFILSYVGVAYGGIIILDAISNVPASVRYQAISTGASTVIFSMFIPGILIFVELVVSIIIITIDKNKSK